jgi:hypothetical protein
MPDSPQTLQIPIPPIVFLGVCDKIARGTGIHVNLPTLNIMGLRPVVHTPIFPLSLDNLMIVQAVFNAPSLQEHEWRMISNSTGVQLLHSKLLLSQVSDEESYPNEERFPVGQLPAWHVIPNDFGKGVIIWKPDAFRIEVTIGDKQFVCGTLEFLYVRAEKPTPEIIAAIKADPLAVKVALMSLECKHCKITFPIFAALERNNANVPSGAIWYEDLKDTLKCECGQLNVETWRLRESMHYMLGHRKGGPEGPLNLTRLYEQSTLETLYREFIALLARKVPEEVIQKFLEKYPLLFQFLTPHKIFNKPKILTKYVADFGILAANGHLTLIEIENTTTKLLNKKGDQHAELTHAMGQANKWLHEIDRHRIASLEMMGLKSEDVCSISAVVIAGLDKGNNKEHLARLKGEIHGRIKFLTYDDLAAAYAILVKEVGGI